MLRRALLTLSLASTALVAALPAAAQEWPARPVRMIIPFAAGGVTDMIGRVVGQGLSQRLGQPVVAENRVGAGGNIGADACAKATDGHTICMGTISSHAINPAIYPRIPFDNLRDFAPVALLGQQPNALVVANALPVRSLQELVAYMKARPGQMNYGSSGVGTSTHLAGELLTQLTGTEATHVPYRSSAQLVTDILAGQLPMSFDNFSSVWPHAREGRMRALAVGSATRWPTAPDLPTVAEILPGFESLSWHGLFAPATTPPANLARLIRETEATLRAPEVTARFADVGIAPGTISGDAFRAFVATETGRWGDVARRANIRAE